MPEEDKSIVSSEVNLPPRIAEFAEIEEQVVGIKAELIERHKISPEFFQDKIKSLIFLAIAQRQKRIREQHLPLEAADAEQALIDQMVILLTLDQSGNYSNYEKDIHNGSGEPDHLVEPVIDKFTQPALTAELKKSIAEGLLDDVKAALGVTTQTEQPYDIRVLSVGDQESTTGMYPSLTEEMNADSDHPELPAMYEAWDQIDEYMAGLEANKQEYMARVGNKGPLPIAWVEHIGDRIVLCMPQHYIEKILHTDQPRANFYDDHAREGDFAYLKHEYVHTQNPVAPKNQLFFGMGFEERRAEFFSGDRHGYQEIKGLYQDVETLSGVSITELIRRNAQSPFSFYVDLAKSLGLEAMLELSVLGPLVYMTEERPMYKKIFDQLGGYDGFLGRLHDQVLATGGEEAMNDRMKARTEYILSHNVLWTNEHRRKFGLNFVSNLVEEAIKK